MLNILGFKYIGSLLQLVSYYVHENTRRQYIKNKCAVANRTMDTGDGILKKLWIRKFKS